MHAVCITLYGGAVAGVCAFMEDSTGKNQYRVECILRYTHKFRDAMLNRITLPDYILR